MYIQVVDVHGQFIRCYPADARESSKDITPLLTRRTSSFKSTCGHGHELSSSDARNEKCQFPKAGSTARLLAFAWRQSYYQDALRLTLVRNVDLSPRSFKIQELISTRLLSCLFVLSTLDARESRFPRQAASAQVPRCVNQDPYGQPLLTHIFDNP